jgi:hypothetical protein
LESEVFYPRVPGKVTQEWISVLAGRWLFVTF